MSAKGMLLTLEGHRHSRWKPGGVGQRNVEQHYPRMKLQASHSQLLYGTFLIYRHVPRTEQLSQILCLTCKCAQSSKTPPNSQFYFSFSTQTGKSFILLHSALSGSYIHGSENVPVNQNLLLTVKYVIQEPTAPVKENTS